MPTETGWYWLYCKPQFSNGAKTGWRYRITRFDTDDAHVMVFVRMDKKKFYVVDSHGTLTSYRLNQISKNAEWKGPLKP